LLACPVVKRSVPRSFGMALLLPLVACSTVEPGEDFSIADIVYDEGYYYCSVEPKLFEYKCGPGNPGEEGSCHFDVTPYRLTDYSPLIGDSCSSESAPTAVIIAPAKANYSSSQAKMQLDPKLAPLLTRPLGKASHPRVVFDPAKDQAAIDVIEAWATKFSTQ